jgi:hypothetical protein
MSLASPPSATVPSSRANKRTKDQKEADLLFIERMSVRGAGPTKIAAALNAARPYSLSKVQVHKDLIKLRERWREESMHLITMQRDRELKRLDVMEEELWEAWERSKRDEMERTMAKVDAVAADKDGKNGNPGRSSDLVKKRQRDGDPSIMGQLIALHDRRVKLLGLAPAAKLELSGPGGAPIPAAALTEEAQLAVHRRHVERMKRAERVEPEPEITHELVIVPAPTGAAAVPAE